MLYHLFLETGASTLTQTSTPQKTTAPCSNFGNTAEPQTFFASAPWTSSLPTGFGPQSVSQLFTPAPRNSGIGSVTGDGGWYPPAMMGSFLGNNLKHSASTVPVQRDLLPVGSTNPTSLFGMNRSHSNAALSSVIFPAANQLNSRDGLLPFKGMDSLPPTTGHRERLFAGTPLRRSASSQRVELVQRLQGKQAEIRAAFARYRLYSMKEQVEHFPTGLHQIISEDFITIFNDQEWKVSSRNIDVEYRRRKARFVLSTLSLAITSTPVQSPFEKDSQCSPSYKSNLSPPSAGETRHGVEDISGIQDVTIFTTLHESHKHYDHGRLKGRVLRLG
ncbi:hypothetical protein F5879DRAFT_926334 [Lentinula edodes]|nr:hypothetical protein F5879DRAFT_926334 [Lentinula edodes]